MAEIVFIIPRTPVTHRNPLRDMLWNACCFALNKQNADNWKAVVVGPQESGMNLSKFHFLEHDLLPKRDKVRLALDYIVSAKWPCTHVARLDDDDLISDAIIDMGLPANADCLFDEYHSFYEISSGRISQQKRNWIPNTCIHKLEHALFQWEQNGKSDYLLCQDHSAAWHIYYQNKTIVTTDKAYPLYLRILSPTSITSTAAVSKEAESGRYLKYLMGFGSWSGTVNKINGFADTVAWIKMALPTVPGKLPEVNWPGFRLLLRRLRGQ